MESRSSSALPTCQFRLPYPCSYIFDLHRLIRCPVSVLSNGWYAGFKRRNTHAVSLIPSLSRILYGDVDFQMEISPFAGAPVAFVAFSVQFKLICSYICYSCVLMRGIAGLPLQARGHFPVCSKIDQSQNMQYMSIDSDYQFMDQFDSRIIIFPAL